MLQRLVASDRPRGLLRGTPGAVLSVTVHGLLIAGALAATRPGEAPPSIPPVLEDTVTWALPPTRKASDPSDVSLSRIPVLGTGSLDGLPEIIGMPAEVSSGIPAPDAAPGFGRGATGGSPTAPWPWATAAGDATAVVAYAVADEAPVLLTRPVLEYPATLRQAGIEDTVMIEVIIDAEGIPEPASFRIVSIRYAGFEAAARRVVLGARYRPGRWRGRPVRILIRQPVAFRLGGVGG
jgi:TonB family protein